MKISELQGELATKPRPCYLAYGGDHYLRYLAQSTFASLIPEPMRPFNLVSFPAGSTDPADLLNELGMLPMGSDYRLCLVTEWHKADKELMDAVSGYLDNPNPAVVLALIGEKVDMRFKLTHRLKTGGLLVECTPPDRGRIEKYIQQTVREHGYQLSPQLAELVVDLCGGDSDEKDRGNVLGTSVQAVLAISDHAGERKILGEEDVRALLSKLDTRTAFNLVDAMGKRKADMALEMALRLLEGIGEVEKMVGLVERQLRLILLAKVNSRETADNLAKILTVKPYFVKEYQAQSKNFTVGRLERLLGNLAKLDVRNKTGRLEGRRGLEMFILEACRK